MRTLQLRDKRWASRSTEKYRKIFKREDKSKWQISDRIVLVKPKIKSYVSQFIITKSTPSLLKCRLDRLCIYSIFVIMRDLGVQAPSEYFVNAAFRARTIRNYWEFNVLQITVKRIEIAGIS